MEEKRGKKDIIRQKIDTYRFYIIDRSIDRYWSSAIVQLPAGLQVSAAPLHAGKGSPSAPVAPSYVN